MPSRAAVVLEAVLASCLIPGSMRLTFIRGADRGFGGSAHMLHW